jgi:hypothetical protein
LVAIVARSDGYLDARGHPIGTDFANVYAAGTYVLEGRSEAPFEPASHYARQQEIFGANTPFHGWHYPPFFLFIALAPAIAFLTVDGLQRGFNAWQKTALAAPWLAPIVARSVAGYAFHPIGV